MDKNDLNVRLDKRVTLNAAAIYLPSYSRADDGGNFAAAKTLLEKHNIGLTVWPTGGGKQTVNTLTLSRYEDPIKKGEESYKQLATDVHSLMKNRAPGYPFIVPIIFCQFDADGVGVTPSKSKIGAAPPVCLISMAAMTMKDKMTILHEMGHSALYPDTSHDLSDPGNLMTDADGRKFMYRYQVEAFGKAVFARSVADDQE